MFCPQGDEGRFQEAGHDPQGGSTPSHEPQGGSASSIVHVSGDQLCFVATVDDRMKGQIAEAAALSPLVEIISEGDGRMVAAVPWSWLYIRVPKQKQL